VSDKPELGTMETEWAENRAKLPDGLFRKTLGKVFGSLYSVGELDKFRLRVERSMPGPGTDIYLIHRGMQEVYTGPNKESTGWQPRARDPQLEGEMLSLLMIDLGVKPEQAKSAMNQALPAQAPKARLISSAPGPSLELDDALDKAWRKVGLALDRGGFSVEDRDRAQGLYFVRYIDPTDTGKKDQGFFGKLFGKTDKPVSQYRVSVKANPQANSSIVAVLTATGEAQSGDTGQRIVTLLLQELQ
jgi:outer membrane protein assembly factor BamC